MKNYLPYAIGFIFAAFLLSGCSEVKDEKIPTQTVISVHGEGFTNPASNNFHAEYIRSNNYDLQTCKSCHGSAYSGGTSGQSCNTCHNKQGGPENCTVCHGSVNAAPPKDLSGNISPTFRGVGAHQKHVLGGILGAPVACKECHAVPTELTSAGHIDATQHAEVRFDSASVFFRSNAQYSATTVSCNNTYCHGNFNGGNQNVTIAWNDTSTAAVACGTCHGDVTKTTLAEKAFPKTGHPAIGSLNCNQCHSRTVNASLAIIDPSRHMNGVVD
jgi:predicted CxxxxCH...CXXCH cytochrome family protein